MRILFLFLFMSTILQAIPYSGNLAAYWSMGQSSGSTMLDSTGLNNGTLYNMASPSGWVASGTNNALQFDGSNDYVIVNHAGRLSYTSGDFSVGIWARPETVGIYTGLISTDIASDQGWKIHMDLGYNRFRARYNSLILDYPTITAGEWHHYGYVKSGTTLSIYMDGVFVTSGTCTSTNPVNGSELVLGSYRIQNARDGYYIYKGKMDEAAIWNRSLNATEMQNVYLDGVTSVTGTIPEPASILIVFLGIGIIFYIFPRS